MTAEVIPMGTRSGPTAGSPGTVGRITLSAPPAPHVQHYLDLARLAWFDRLVTTLQDAERVFSQLSSADDEFECLVRMREVIDGVRHL